MDYLFSVSGTDVEATHVPFPRIAEILSRSVVPARLRGLRISAKRNSRLEFDLETHTAPVTLDRDANLRVEGLHSKVFQLIDLSSSSVSHPITLKIPVSRGVEGKHGTSLFTGEELKDAIVLAVDHLRALELQIIKQRVKKAAEQSIVSPNRLSIENRDERIGCVVRTFPDAKKNALELVMDWDKDEIDALCRTLTLGTWWTFYLQKNKRIVEDTTVDKLVAECQARLRM